MKAKIKLGNVDIPEDAFEPKNVKARITMWVGMDLLDEVRKRAAQKDLPYQTYLNQILRNAIFGSDEEKRIRKLIREELAKTGA
ncbi:MAG: hypothetical protein HYW49_01410 [Deltaproteobacteria bacterium]|nr:hypothetical protein [Deltaproteobacteria bacterium]